MPTSDIPTAVRARWIFPIDQPPIEGGIVTLAGGKIAAVGENQSAAPPRDLGDVALLPGFVNAHTHLEFSELKQPLGQPGMSFAAWIAEVIAYRQAILQQHFNQPQEMLRLRQNAIAHGLAESTWRGVAAIGEIGTRAFTDWFQDQVSGAPHCTVFLELLGLAPERAAALLDMATEYLDEPPAIFVHGLSPHAPYTVGPALLDSICRLSAAGQVPLAMHLAESRDELELLADHRGPLVELLGGIGAWYPDTLPQGARPLDYLRLLATAHRALVIHGNYLAAEEIEFLAAHRERMSVVYCPRTHAYFGHEPYPLAGMLASGLHVAIGTDSRASNPDLSLFNELQEIARRHPAVSPETILRLGSLAGAEALGLADQFGTITAGKRAALAVVPLPDLHGDPSEGVLGAAINAAISLDMFLAPEV